MLEGDRLTAFGIAFGVLVAGIGFLVQSLTGISINLFIGILLMICGFTSMCMIWWDARKKKQPKPPVTELINATDIKTPNINITIPPSDKTISISIQIT